MTNLVARLYVMKISDTVVSGVELPADTSGQTDSGNAFRYDATTGQYIFNWSTRGLSEGTWRLRVELLDSSTQTVLVGLRK